MVNYKVKLSQRVLKLRSLQSKNFVNKKKSVPKKVQNAPKLLFEQKQNDSNLFEVFENDNQNQKEEFYPDIATEKEKNNENKTDIEEMLEIKNKETNDNSNKSKENSEKNINLNKVKCEECEENPKIYKLKLPLENIFKSNYNNDNSNKTKSKIFDAPKIISNNRSNNRYLRKRHILQKEKKFNKKKNKMNKRKNKKKESTDTNCAINNQKNDNNDINERNEELPNEDNQILPMSIGYNLLEEDNNQKNNDDILQEDKIVPINCNQRNNRYIDIILENLRNNNDYEDYDERINPEYLTNIRNIRNNRMFYNGDSIYWEGNLLEEQYETANRGNIDFYQFVNTLMIEKTQTYTKEKDE